MNNASQEMGVTLFHHEAPCGNSNQVLQKPLQ